MTEEVITRICDGARLLGLPLSSAELGTWAVDNSCNDNMLNALEGLFAMLQEKEQAALSEELKTKARLSRVKDYTFENYAVGHLNDADRTKMMMLKTLAFMDARKNIILLGPDGTGKSHVAQAIGNECCNHGYRTLYISATQFNSMARKAAQRGTVDRLVHRLVNYDCLIIDDLSKEKYDSDQSYILYRVVDGRAGRTKPGSTVVTTAMDFNILSEKFADKEYFISTVGKLTQGSICFTFSGKSYWGQDKTIIPLKLLD